MMQGGHIIWEMPTLVVRSQGEEQGKRGTDLYPALDTCYLVPGIEPGAHDH